MAEQRRNAFQLEALEPRLLLSGEGVAMAGDVWEAIGAEAATTVMEVPLEVQEDSIAREEEPSALWGDLLDQAAPIFPAPQTPSGDILDSDTAEVLSPDPIQEPESTEDANSVASTSDTVTDPPSITANSGFNSASDTVQLMETGGNQPDRPVLVLPGIAATLWADGHADEWYVHRGVHPNQLQVDPLLGSLDDVITTLDNVGYTRDQDLFVANYDWRMAPGPSPPGESVAALKPELDGVITGLSADALTDETFEYGVDYLGYWLDQAAQAWESAHGTAPISVDIIAHSTGGLVARSYIQSEPAAYGGSYIDDAGTERQLPTIHNFAMVGVPNRGASKAWNPLQNNFATDPAFRVVLSKIFSNAYERLLNGETIEGADYDIPAADPPSPTDFIEQYVPTVRGLLATYPFLSNGPFPSVEPAPDPQTLDEIGQAGELNKLVLDLNDGLDLFYSVEDLNNQFEVQLEGESRVRRPHRFVEQLAPGGQAVVIYNDSFDTPTLVEQRQGPIAGEVNLISDFDQFVGDPPGAEQTWYRDIPVRLGEPENGLAPQFPGDETVPRRSSFAQFDGFESVHADPDRFQTNRIDDLEFNHGILTAQPDAQKKILETLGFTEGVHYDPNQAISQGLVKDGPELLSAVLRFDILELSEVLTTENLREVLDGNLSGVLSSDQAKEEVETGFRAMIAAGGNWLVNQVAGEPALTDPLPLIGKSLGEMIAIDGSLNDAIFDAGLGLGSAILESIENENTGHFGEDLRLGLNQVTSDLEFLIDESRTFGGLLPSDTADFNGAIQDNQILFNAGLTASEQQTVPISLGTAAEQQQIVLQGETEVQVDVTVHLDLTLGYDLAGTLAERERPFIRLNDLSAEAEVHTEELQAEALVGFLQAEIQNGEVWLSGEAALTLNNPDGDAQDRVTQLELEDTQPSELFTLSGTGMLEVSLPIQASWGDYSPAETPVVRLTDDNVLAGPVPAVTLQDFDELVDFTHLNAAGFFGVLGQLRNWFGQFSGTELFETQLPFTSDRSVGDALEMGEAFTQAILDPLTETSDPENPNQAQPSFRSAQGFLDQLAAAAGVDPVTLNPAFDPITHELTFHLPLQEQWTGDPVPFELNASASPLADITSGSTVQVAASLDGGLTLGMILTPVAAELTGANDAPANGQLSGDAEFTLTVGGEDPVQVNLPSDSSNTNVTDLVADFNAALETAGIGHLVRAQRQENRVRLQTVSLDVPPSLKLETADPNDPILTELHFTDGQSDSDTVSQHAFVEDASLTGQVTLSADEIDATGRFGFLSVGIDDGTATVNGTVQVALADPTTATAGGRIGLRTLFDSLGADLNALVTDNAGDSLLSIQGNASAELPVHMRPNLLGGDHPASPVITLDWSDITDPSTINLQYNGDMDRLLEYRNLRFADILDGLAQLAEFLRNQAPGNSFLGEELPLLGVSLNELIDYGGDLADRVDQLQQNPAGTLDALETALEQALDLDPQLVSLSLEPDLLRIDLEVQHQITDSAFTLDFDLAEAIANASNGSQLSVPGGSELLDVRAEATFTVEAGSSLNLDFGFDLSDPSAPAPVLLDSTGLSFEVKAEGSGLEGSIALGPLGLFIKQGEVRLDDGSAARSPATIEAGLNPEPDNGWYAIGELNAGDLNFNVQAAAEATLPLYFPTESDRLSPDLHFAVGDLASPGSTTTLDGPDLSSLIANLDLSNNLDAVIQGLDLLLEQLQIALENKVFGRNFPLVGDQLKQGADVIGDIRTEILSRLENAGGKAVDQVQQALFDALGPDGINFLGDTNNDGATDVGDVVVTPDNPSPTTDEIAFEILLDPAVNLLDAGVDFDLGLPALGLEADGQINADLGLDLRLAFGISRSDGFFFDTAAADELSAGLNVSLPGFAATGSLAFLQVDVEDRAEDPSSFDAGFSVDFQDLNGDDRLTWEELNGGPAFDRILDAQLAGNADVNLDLHVHFGGNANFPSLTAGLDVDWNFDAGDLDGSKPMVAFNDVQLNAGEFFSRFAGPILEEIQRITQPLQPVIDVLTAEVPIIDAKVIDLAAGAIPGVTNPKLSGQFLDAVAGLIDLVNNMPVVDDDVVIDLGGFTLNPDVRGQTNLEGIDLQNDLAASLPGDNPLEQLAAISNATSDFISESSDVGGSGTGLNFPLLEQPLQAFGLLLGQDVDLFTYDMSPIDFEFGFSFPFGPFPVGPVPVTFEFGGGISGAIDLGFGYDTSGFRLFSQTNEVEDILAGFYVSDTENADGTGDDLDEAWIRGELTAGAMVGVSALGAGARGGLGATLAADLRDADGDGRVHANEFVQSVQHGLNCTFSLNGSVEVFLEVFARVGGAEISEEIASATLAEFTTGDEPCFAGRFEANETRESAADIGVAPGIHATGDSISESGDRDWYRFEVPRQQSIEVNAEFNHSFGNVDMEIYDAQGQLLQRSTSQTDNESVTLADAEPGDYYIYVYGRGPNDYNLSVEPAAQNPATVYYVNANGEADFDNTEDDAYYTLAPGDDANNGLSPESPKQTLSGLFQSHDPAPGDVVVLDTGNYDGTATIASGQGGATYAGSPAGSVLEAAGAPAVHLDGSDGSLFTGLQVTGSGVGVRVDGDAVGNVIQGVEFGSNTGVTLDGDANGTIVENNTFTGATGVRIAAENGNPTGNVIRDNLFRGSTGVALESSQTNRVEQNRFETHQDGVILLSGADGDVTDNDFEVSGGNGLRIESDATGLIRNNGISGAETGVVNHSGAVQIQRNSIRENTTGFTGNGLLGIDDPANANEIFENQTGILIPESAEGQVIRFNKVYDNEIGIQSLGDNVNEIYGNEVYGNRIGIKAGAVIGGDNWTDPNRIYENTEAGIQAGNGAEVRFNRIYRNTIGVDGANDLFLHHNLIYRNSHPAGEATEARAVLVNGTQANYFSDNEIRIENNTIFAPQGDGIRLENTQYRIFIRNNIVWTQSGFALWLEIERDYFIEFESDYNNFFATGDGALVHYGKAFDDLYDWQVEAGFDLHSIGRTDPDPGRDQPRFVDLANDDYQLRSGSTSIDAGDPASALDAEPAPDGGRINLGAYGNTAQAAASPQSAIRIEFPEFHVDWETDRTRQIRWSTFNVNGEVEIAVVDQSGNTTAIDTVAAEAGSIEWKPADSGLPADSNRQYRIRITSVADSGVSDESREMFSIPSPGTQYYVDDGSNDQDLYTGNAVGDNRNSGKSPQRPKAGPLAMINAYDFDPGDVIRIDSGRYLALHNLYIGPEDAGVHILGASNGPNPVAQTWIDRAYAPLITDDFGDEPYLFELDGADGTTLEGMHLTGAYTEVYDEHFIDGSDSDFAVIRNNTILKSPNPRGSGGSTGKGIGLDGFNAIVEGNRVIGFNEQTGSRIFASTGISVDHTGVVVEGNEVSGFDLGIGIAEDIQGNPLGESAVTVKNNRVHENRQGIATSDAGADDAAIAFLNNRVYDNLNTGMFLNTGPRSTAAENEVWGNGGAGIYLERSTGKNNLVHDNAGGGIFSRFGSRILNNRVYHNGEFGIRATFNTRTDGELDPDYTVDIRYNRVYDNPIGIDGLGDLEPPIQTIYFNGQIKANLVYNNSESGIRVTKARGNPQIFNNTVYQPDGAALTFADAQGYMVRNNILVVQSGPAMTVSADSQSGFDSDRNLFFLDGNGAVAGIWGGTDQPGLDDWQTATGVESNTIVSDPQFADIDGSDGVLGYRETDGRDGGADDDFGLVSGSPAIDRGQTLGSPRLDLVGATRFDDPQSANAGPVDSYAEQIADGSRFSSIGQAERLLLGDADDGMAAIELPFAFPWYGQSYELMAISTNGFVEFGVQEPSFEGAPPIPPDSAMESLNSHINLREQPRLAPLFEDLAQVGETNFGVTNPQVYVDRSVAGQLTVRWSGIAKASGNPVNVSVTLFNTGAVRFDYGSGNTALKATIGVSAGNGDQFVLSAYDEQSELTRVDSVRFEPAPGFVDLGAVEFGGQPVAHPEPTVTIDGLITNEQQPVLSGRVDDAYARVEVKIGDLVVIPATEYENGAWEAETYELDPLQDGAYEIIATAATGNRLIGQSTSEELRIDTVAPEVAADFLTTQDGHPMLTGTVDDPQATVKVVVDGRTLSDDPMFGTNFDLNQEDGTWAGHIGEFFALNPGVYDVQVEAVDAVGNTGNDGTIGELVIGQTVDGLGADPVQTQDRTPELSGTVSDPDYQVEVRVSDQGPFTAVNQGDGTWVLPSDTLEELEPGVYEVRVTVTNAAGAFVGSDTTGSELTILGEAHFSGDVDANLVVNDRDLYAVWQEQLKPASERDPAMDLNGDGSVDDSDLNTVKGHYLQSFGPAPSSWGAETEPVFRHTWIALESKPDPIDRSMETFDRQRTDEKSGLLFRGQSLKGLTEGSPEVREVHYWQRWRTEA